MLLNNKYIVLENIARGQFGEIVKVEYNDTYYAVKIGNKDVIKYEIEMYKKLKGVANISRLYNIFEYGDNFCMVLDYYSKTLYNVKEEQFLTINYSINIINYIKQLIVIINGVHNKNIIHRDLKPSNICLNNNNTLFLIDFGISKIYKNGTIHNNETTTRGFLGSTNFSSLNAINLIEQSRRDDIESVIYILLYMLLSNERYNDYDKLNSFEKKDILVIIAFCENMYNINTNMLTKLFNYIRRLKYNQQPNYEYILSLLSTLIT